MKNIRVTLDEKTAAWPKDYAARRKQSLSSLLGELLREKMRMRKSREYEAAMQRFWAIKARNLSDDKPYPSRSEWSPPP